MLEKDICVPKLEVIYKYYNTQQEIKNTGLRSTEPLTESHRREHNDPMKTEICHMHMCVFKTGHGPSSSVICLAASHNKKAQ